MVLDDNTIILYFRGSMLLGGYSSTQKRAMQGGSSMYGAGASVVPPIPWDSGAHISPLHVPQLSSPFHRALSHGIGMELLTGIATHPTAIIPVLGGA